MKRNRWIPGTLALALLLSLAANARAPTVADSAEARTAAALDRIASSPPRLRMFLQAMPKGGDLHNHIGGVNYAEDFLDWAAADGRCITVATLTIVDPPCDAPGRRPVEGLKRDYDAYSTMIDALSTRGIVISDLLRTASSYWAVTALSCLIGNKVVRHDGPLSVRRAFLPQELSALAAESGFPYLKSKREPWFRVSLAGEKK